MKISIVSENIRHLSRKIKLPNNLGMIVVTLFTLVEEILAEKLHNPPVLYCTKF